jgi:hypothetical protein
VALQAQLDEIVSCVSQSRRVKLQHQPSEKRGAFL